MTVRSLIAAAALGLCLSSTNATATRQNAPTVSFGEAKAIAGKTLTHAIGKSLGRAATRRAIGGRRGLFNAVKNHGLRVRKFNEQPERGKYTFLVYATIKTQKGKARKDVKSPFISVDVDARTGAATVWTTGSGEILRGKKFIRTLLPNLREHLTHGSMHID